MEEAKGGQCGGSQAGAMKVKFSGAGTWRMFEIQAEASFPGRCSLRRGGIVRTSWQRQKEG